MIDARIEQGPATPALTGWLSVAADAYLDARRPEWHEYERAGLVRYVRLPGERGGRLFVAPTATEIAAALVTPPVPGLEGSRPAKAEALPR